MYTFWDWVPPPTDIINLKNVQNKLNYVITELYLITGDERNSIEEAAKFKIATEQQHALEVVNVVLLYTNTISTRMTSPNIMNSVYFCLKTGCATF